MRVCSCECSCRGLDLGVDLVFRMCLRTRKRVLCVLCALARRGEFLNNERDPKKTPENMRLYAHTNTHLHCVHVCTCESWCDWWAIYARNVCVNVCITCIHVAVKVNVSVFGCIRTIWMCGVRACKTREKMQWFMCTVVGRYVYTIHLKETPTTGHDDDRDVDACLRRAHQPPPPALASRHCTHTHYVQCTMPAAVQFCNMCERLLAHSCVRVLVG